MIDIDIDCTTKHYDGKLKHHIETQHGGKYSMFIKNIIFGGIDGVITTFAIITASYAADINVKTILILGLSNVLADGFSMGFGDYASSYSELQHFNTERKKEELEYETNFEQEVEELVDLYIDKGICYEDSIQLVNILAKQEYKTVFLDHMMLLELNIPLPDSNHEVIMKAIITTVSFYIFGLVPLFIYILAKLFSFHNKNAIFACTSITCAITLFCIGSFGSYISKQSIVKGGLITLSNGAFASGLAYIIGFVLHKTLN